MDLKKLDASFYADNPRLIQALDFDEKTGKWVAGKTRGHGIVKVEVFGITFAVPVRSNIKHNASFILEVNRKDRSVKGMGLDYSKALIVKSPHHVSSDIFVLRSKHAGRKLLGKEEHIKKQITKYIDRYIQAVKDDDRNVLNSIEYRFTTLVNYHAELGI